MDNRPCGNCNKIKSCKDTRKCHIWRSWVEVQLASFDLTPSWEKSEKLLDKLQ